MANNNQDKIEKGIESGLRIKPYFHFDADEAWTSFSREMNLPATPEPDIKPLFSIIDLLKYAAIFIIVCGIFTAITKPVQFTDSLTTRQKNEQITLFDGSVIELSENTSIQYPVRSKDIVVRRVVVESGKATFTVKKHALPFIVSAYPLEIVVTGTTFTVEKTPAGVFVSQDEGKVEVKKPGEKLNPVVLQNGEKIKMLGGEIFVARKGEEYIQVSAFTFPSLEKAEKLRKDSLTKVNVTTAKNVESAGLTYQMKDVVTFLEKKYKKQIRFKKKRKLKSNDRVTLHLDKELSVVLNALKKQGKIDFEPGKCEGCYIVSPPPKK